MEERGARTHAPEIPRENRPTWNTTAALSPRTTHSRGELRAARLFRILCAILPHHVRPLSPTPTLHTPATLIAK